MVVAASDEYRNTFGNVTMTNTPAFRADLASGESFTSTLENLPSHTEITGIVFSVSESFGQVDPHYADFAILVDGAPVPCVVNYAGGTGMLAITVPMVPHAADTATITVIPADMGSDDRCQITGENVAIDQDAWIDPVQLDGSRDGQRPVIVNLVRGDDSGAPQATDQAQDVYFRVTGGEPGLVGSDGTVTPVDAWATYADFSVSIPDQPDGLTYDSTWVRFKATTPAGQSSIQVVLTPTNLFGEAGVPALQPVISLFGDATDATTQLPFSFNAWLMDPTTQQSTQLSGTTQSTIHALVAVDDNSTLSDEELNILLQDLDSSDSQTRNSAWQQLYDLVVNDPTNGVYDQLSQYLNPDDPNLTASIERILDAAFPFGSPVLVTGANRLVLASPTDWMHQHSDPGSKFTVTVTSSQGTVMFDDLNNTNTTDLIGSDTIIPDVLIEPKVTGQLTLTITIQEYIPNTIAPGMWLANGTPKTEEMVCDVVETNP